ncbi:hypothetical protein BS50DRAFT_197425 [Corynespora cassiicola Philippines]|uniref:Uncharacterized protein n=1 Tax=Corynespora cassiicola Philippines TaxID=1448308 RepID=A0A2T2N5P1_CORCC|nr:hypothetical protein BS50DRAFT_197425 [Corynespora cassiicola Philippines]
MDGRTDAQEQARRDGSMQQKATKTHRLLLPMERALLDGVFISFWIFAWGALRGSWVEGVVFVWIPIANPFFYSVTLALVYLQRHVWLFERASETALLACDATMRAHRGGCFRSRIGMDMKIQSKSSGNRTEPNLAICKNPSDQKAHAASAAITAHVAYAQTNKAASHLQIGNRDSRAGSMIHAPASSRRAHLPALRSARPSIPSSQPSPALRA